MPDQTFTWGESVRVDDAAPPKLRPGHAGAVVGMWETADGMTYTVEFGDGKDAEIPGSLLTSIEPE